MNDALTGRESIGTENSKSAGGGVNVNNVREPGATRGVNLNNVREPSATRAVTTNGLRFSKHVVLRKGKKNYVVVTAW